MNKLMLAMSIFVAVTASVVAQTGASIDPITVSRLEALVNQRKLVSTDMTTIPGSVIYTYRQSGVTWTVTNLVNSINGTVPPTRYSVLKLLTAIADAGKYDEAKAALQAAKLPNGMPYWDALNAAQFLTADDARLQSGCALAVQSGFCTSNDVVSILEKAEG